MDHALAAWRAFSDALLTQTFDAKRLDGGGGKVRLQLLGDRLCISGPTSRDAEPEVEPYAEMVISFDRSILTLTSSETEATKRFQIGVVDGPRIVAELDDRIQLAHHVSMPSISLAKLPNAYTNQAFQRCQMLHKEEQWKLSLCGSGDLPTSSTVGNRFNTAAYRRKLDELSGKTEPERVAAAVDKILSGASAEDQREITRPLLHFLTATFKTLLAEPNKVAMHVREVITDLQETILDPDGDRIAGLVKQLAEPNSEALETLPRIVNERLEYVVVAPVLDQIEDCITRSFDPAHLYRVDSKREALRANPQEYFGIAADCTSPSGWRAAVDEVNKIAQHQMPSGKLHALLRSTTKIYDVFTAEQSARASAAANDDDVNKPPADQFLAADEFLSVFIFVLVQSTLDKLPVTCRFMSELCDPELLSGEHGYYLTVFESAIQCIADSEADRDLISAVARTSSSIYRSSGISPRASGMSPRASAANVEEESLSEADDIDASRQTDSPLSTGEDSDGEVELFAAPKNQVDAVLEQDDLEDSPLFRTAPRRDRPKKIPSRTHPGRVAICAQDSTVSAVQTVESDGDDDEVSKSAAGQWMKEVETAFQRGSSATSIKSSGDCSEASDWGHSLFGSDTETDSAAAEGDISWSSPPRIGSVSSEVSGVGGDESHDAMV